MGIFDAFTGSSLKKGYGNAANIAMEARDENMDYINQYFGQGRNELNNGTNAAINTISGGRDAAAGQVQSFDARALAALSGGVQGAQDQLALARGAAGQQGSAYAPLEALAGQYGQGRETYIDALGLNGQDGLGRAQDAFGSSLQNTFEIDQGLDAINRARNMRGGTVSGGNIDRDAMVFGQGLANSRSGQYLDRLAGLTDRELSATGAASAGRAGAASLEAGLYGAEADLLQGGGINAANLATQTGGRLSALTTDASNNVGNLQSSRASALANLALGQGSAIINENNRFADVNQTAAIGRGQADNQASANALNFGINLAKAGAQAAGGFGGGGGAGLPTGGGFGGGFFGLPA